MDVHGRVAWNAGLSWVAREFDFSERETARIKAATETRDGYVGESLVVAIGCYGYGTAIRAGEAIRALRHSSS